MTDLGIPALRLRRANQAPVRGDRAYVLYWMIAQRRLRSNFALQHAAHRARELGLPLVILEALRVDYPWASERIHRFVIDGMIDNASAAERRPVAYFPFVEAEAGQGSGLLEALASRAACVVTDEFPCFFLPAMVASAADRIDVALEVVDSNGLLPLRAADRPFGRAVDLRRWLQKHLAEHLVELPVEDPLLDLPTPEPALLEVIRQRWPAADLDAAPMAAALARLPIDHEVGVVGTRGGSAAAEARLERFLCFRLARYVDGRTDLDHRATSELSAHLHFGHIGVHQIFRGLGAQERWSPDRLATFANGKREGWWGMSAPAESFLDELVTWRELGYLTAYHQRDHDRYEGLPTWARTTLELHQDDHRPHLYDRATLELARTHDPVWNAAQGELRAEGTIHNYLRMLWGKKILEWTASPREAFELLVELNNRWSIDGRNPNSYTGISWVLGRYDRPWAPQRPIFGSIRYMSSASTARKIKLDRYLRRYGAS